MIWQTLAAFNLVCTGTLSTIGEGPIERNPYSVEFRIDPVAEQFCMNSCLEVEAIHTVRVDGITFRFRVNGTSKTRHFYQHETGKYIGEDTRISPDGNLSVLRDATCKIAPFTGLSPF